MSARKRKANNRERTVTTFREDPNTSFLVPLPSEDPPTFAMSFQNYVQQQHPFFSLPPGNNDLEILENLKTIIKDGQHEFYRAVPQPAALAALYMGHVQPSQDQQEYPTPRLSHDTCLDNPDAVPNVEPDAADASPAKIASEPASPVQDAAPIKTEAPPVDATGEYATQQPTDPPSPAKPTLDVPKNEEEQPRPSSWDRPTADDDTNADHNVSPTRASALDNTPRSRSTDARLPPPDDARLYDRDRDRDRDSRDRFVDHRDRDSWDRDRDRHDPIVRPRERRPEFFGRSYGRSHAPRPPPELRHYEPSYGADYVPPPRRYDPDDRRPGLRVPPFDDRKHSPYDDRRPPFEDRRPPATVDDRRLPFDERPIRPLPASDSRPLRHASEDRLRPAGEAMPPTRPTAEDDRGPRATSLVADDRPRAAVPLEERLSQPTSAPSLQDRLSQPVPVPALPAAPARAEITSAPTLEERLSLGPVPSRIYPRTPSVARDDLRTPLPKDDPRDHDRATDFRPARDFSRERPGASITTAPPYRPDLDRSFGERDERERRDRDVPDIDPPPARFGDSFARPGPPPQRRYSPPLFDRDRERDRARPFFPPRSPPPFRGEGTYLDGERRYANDRDRDAFEQRRREWYGPGDDKRGPPPPPPPAPSWRPDDRPPFVDRDRNRERFDRDRERERDIRDRDRDLGGLGPPPPPPTRGQWEERDRRFPPSPPPPRMDSTQSIGPTRSLSARLTDYPPPTSDNQVYPPPRDFDRGRYGMDDHPPFSRVRNRSPSPPRRTGLDDLRPPIKRVREDNAPSYVPPYSPPRRGGEYPPGPPSSSTATTAPMISSVPPRSAGTRSPPHSVPSTGPPAFYERGDREREREREFVRGDYGMGYDRDGRGRRSPPLPPMTRVPGYGRGVGDRREARYVAPPPRTT